MTQLQRSPVDDHGFSLVELAVYVLVFGVISIIIVTVVLSLFRSEQTVSDMTVTANESQVITLTLDKDIRNARAVKITPTTVTASVAGTAQVLNWECVRWGVSPTTGEVTRQVFPDTGSVPNWGAGGVIAENAFAAHSAPFFTGGSGAAESGTAIGTVTYNIGLQGNNGGSVVASGEVTNRVPATGARCW